MDVPSEDDETGRMLAAGGQGEIALVAGGGHLASEFSTSFTNAVLAAAPGGSDFSPIESRVFEKRRFGDIAAHKDLVLLGGARQGTRNLMPYSVWTRDLTTFKRVRFPKASERLPSFVYAVAFSRNGARAVAGGDADSRGAMWFSRVVTE